VVNQYFLRSRGGFLRLESPWALRKSKWPRNGASNLAAILRVSVMHLLFGQEAPPELPATTYSEVARRLRAQMNDRAMSVDQMSDLVGWKLEEYLDDPDKLAELPIFGLRWVCKAVEVDWATTLVNPTARLASG